MTTDQHGHIIPRITFPAKTDSSTISCNKTGELKRKPRERSVTGNRCQFLT